MSTDCGTGHGTTCGPWETGKHSRTQGGPASTARSLGLPGPCSSAFCFCKWEERQNVGGVGTDNCSSSLRGRAESADGGLCLTHDVQKQGSFF